MNFCGVYQHGMHLFCGFVMVLYFGIFLWFCHGFGVREAFWFEWCSNIGFWVSGFAWFRVWFVLVLVLVFECILCFKKSIFVFGVPKQFPYASKTLWGGINLSSFSVLLEGS